MITDKTATPEPDSDPKMPLGEDIAAAFTALRRASTVARRRAIETSGSVAIFRNGEIIWVTDLDQTPEEDAENA
jgi:hypothetical protein